MTLGEFSLIDRYFARAALNRSDVSVGIGDDGAVLAVPQGQELVAVTDTLVAGVHFPPGSPAASVGHRALAVNLSDLAAMGASPAWALLALTLPEVDEAWLEAFAEGLAALASEHGVQLVGGDTTSGPLTITVHALGFVAQGCAIRRAGGKPGDRIFVSGTPGDAAFGLALEQGRASADAADGRSLRDRFLFPAPRLALGARLVGIASACIDVSDGLGGDLAKLVAASGCGAAIDLAHLPLSPGLVRAVGPDQARGFALTGGDDYELCFTVPEARLADLEQRAPRADHDYREIGRLTGETGVVIRADGDVIEFSHSGYDHFGR